MGRVNASPAITDASAILERASLFSGSATDAIAQLKKDVKLRTDLKDFHLTDEQVAELVRISRHPNLYNNPVDITDRLMSLTPKALQCMA